MLDFHNHLIPGVDDGAATIAEARSGLKTFQREGVTHIITTPHIRASLTGRPIELNACLNSLDAAWSSLASLAQTEFDELRLDRGVELMLDIPHPILDDPRLRLAETSCVLVEFPFMRIPPHSTVPIYDLGEGGWTPIIAHPERYAAMSENYGLLQTWKTAGARLQVNSGSLLGFYGKVPRTLAWQILGDGLADYLSSDYHSRGKCAVERCSEMMKDVGGEAHHVLLTSTNPQRMLKGDKPLAVPPFVPEPTAFWKRILRW